MRDENSNGFTAGNPVAAGFDKHGKSANDLSGIIRIIIIIMAAFLVANFVMGLNNHRIARDNCQKQLDLLNKSIAKYGKQSDDTKKALTMKDDDVADPETINVLNRAVDDQQNALSDQHTCDASASATKLSNQTASIQGYQQDLQRKSQAVDDAAKAVLKSHDANNVDDAKKTVEDKIVEAKELVANASVKIKRTKTYQALKAGVNSIGDKIANSNFDSVKAYTDLKNTLQSLIDNFKQ